MAIFDQKMAIKSVKSLNFRAKDSQNVRKPILYTYKHYPKPTLVTKKGPPSYKQTNAPPPAQAPICVAVCFLWVSFLRGVRALVCVCLRLRVSRVCMCVRTLVWGGSHMGGCAGGGYLSLFPVGGQLLVTKVGLAVWDSVCMHREWVCAHFDYILTEI